VGNDRLDHLLPRHPLAWRKPFDTLPPTIEQVDRWTENSKLNRKMREAMAAARKKYENLP